MIGATDGSTDNKLQGDGIIVILKEAVAGALGVVTITGTTEQLTSTLYTNVGGGVGQATSTVSNIYPNEARGDGAEGIGGDAVNAESNVEEIATPASSQNRVAW